MQLLNSDNQDHIFRDREEAGKLLAGQLIQYKKDNPYILALPRGGVVVGYEVAKLLDASFNVVIVRKIGAPHNPEFAIGAIAEEGAKYLDQVSINLLQISKNQLKQIIDIEKKEISRRIELYRNKKPLPELKGKTVILVDDGLATGSTAQAAIKAVKKKHPRKIIFAAPVCAASTAMILKEKIAAVICSHSPQDLQAIGQYYQNFQQVSDEEVMVLLRKKQVSRVS